MVHRTAQQGWSTKLEEAAIVRTVDDARKLLAEAVADDHSTVGAYIALIIINADGSVAPGNLRERISRERAHDRSAGRDLGA